MTQRENGDELYKTWRNLIVAQAQKDKDKFTEGGEQYVIPIFNTLDNLYRDHRRYDIISDKDVKSMGDNFYQLILNGQKSNKDTKQKAAILEAAYYFTNTMLPLMEEYHEDRRAKLHPEAYYRWKDAFTNTVYNEYIADVSHIDRDEVPGAAARIFDYFWDLYDRKLVPGMENLSADEAASVFDNNFFKEYNEGMNVHDSVGMRTEMQKLGYRFIAFVRENPAISKIRDKDATDWPSVKRSTSRPKQQEQEQEDTTEESEEGENEEEEDRHEHGGSTDVEDDDELDTERDLDPSAIGKDKETFSKAKDFVNPVLPGDKGFFDDPEFEGLFKDVEEGIKAPLKYTGPGNLEKYSKIVVKAAMKALKDVVISRSIQIGAEALQAWGAKKGGPTAQWTGKLYDAFIQEDITPLLKMDFNKVFGEGIGRRVYRLVQDAFYDTADGKPRPVQTVLRHTVAQLGSLLANKVLKRWNNGFVNKIREKAPDYIANKLIGNNKFRSKNPVAILLGFTSRGAYNAVFDNLNRIIEKKLPYAGGLFKEPGVEVRRIMSENPKLRLPNLKSLIGPKRQPPTAVLTPTQLRGKPIGEPKKGETPVIRPGNPPRRGDTSAFSDFFGEHTAQHPMMREVRALTRLSSLIGRGQSIRTQKDLTAVINSAPANERDTMRAVINNNFKGMAIHDVPKAAKARLDSIMKGVKTGMPSIYEGELIKGMTSNGLGAFVYSRTQNNIKDAAMIDVGANAIAKGREIGNKVANQIMNDGHNESADIRAQRAYYTAYVTSAKQGNNHITSLMAASAATFGVWGTSGTGKLDGNKALTGVIQDFSVLNNDKKATDGFKLETTRTFASLKGKMKKLGRNSFSLGVMDTFTKGAARAASFMFNSRNTAAAITPQKPKPFKATPDSALDVMNRRLSVAHRARQKVLTKRTTTSDLTNPTHLDYGIINAVTMFPGGPDDFIDGIKQIGDAAKETAAKAASKIKQVLTHPSTIFMASVLIDSAPAIGGILGFAASGGNPIVGAGGSAIATQLAARAAGSMGGYMLGRSMKKWNPAQYRSMPPAMIPAGIEAANQAGTPAVATGQTVGVRKTADQVKPRQSRVEAARRQDPRTEEQQIAIDMFTMTDILKQVTVAMAIESVYGNQMQEGQQPEQFIRETPISTIGLTAASAFLQAALENPDISRLLRINLGNNVDIGFSNRGISTDIHLDNADISIGTGGASASVGLGTNVAGTINLDYSGVLSGMLSHSSGFTPTVAFGFAGDNKGMASVGLSYSGVPLIAYGKGGLTLIGSVSIGKGGEWVLNNREALSSLVSLAGQIGINVLMRSDNALVRNYGPSAVRIATRGAAAAITRTAFIQAGKAGLAMITPAGWLFAAHALLELGSAIYRSTVERRQERMIAWNDELLSRMKGIDSSINPILQSFHRTTQNFHDKGSEAYRRVIGASSFDSISREDLRAAQDELVGYAIAANRAMNSLVYRADNHRDLVNMFDDDYLRMRGLTRDDLITNSARLRSEVFYLRTQIKHMRRDAMGEAQRIGSMHDNYDTIQQGIKSGTGIPPSRYQSGTRSDPDAPFRTKKSEQDRERSAEMHAQRSEDLNRRASSISYGLIDSVLSGKPLTAEQRAEIAPGGTYDQVSSRRLDETIHQAIPIFNELIDLMSVFNTEADRERFKGTVKGVLKGRARATVDKDGNVVGTPITQDARQASSESVGGGSAETADDAEEESSEMTDPIEDYSEGGEDDAESSVEDPTVDRSKRIREKFGARLSDVLSEKAIKFQSSSEYASLLKLANTASAKDSLLMQLISVDDIQLTKEAYNAALAKAYMALEAMNAKIDDLERNGAPQSEIDEANEALNSLRSTMVKKLQDGAVEAYKSQFNEVLQDSIKSFRSLVKMKQDLFPKLYNILSKRVERLLRDEYSAPEFLRDELLNSFNNPNITTLEQLKQVFLLPFVNENVKSIILNAVAGPSSDEELRTVLHNYRSRVNDIVSASKNNKEFNGYSAFNDAVDMRGRILQLAQYIDEMNEIDTQLFGIAKMAALSQGVVIEDSYSRGDVHEENMKILEDRISKYQEKLKKFEKGSNEYIMYSNRIHNIEQQVEREKKDLSDSILRALGSADKILGEVYNTHGQSLKGYILSAHELLESIDGNGKFSRLGTHFSDIINELRLGLDTVVSQVEERMSSSDVYSRGTLKDLGELEKQYNQEGYSRSLIHELMAIKGSDVSTDKEKARARLLLSKIEAHIDEHLKTINLKGMKFDDLRNLYRSMKTDYDNPILYHVVKEYDSRRVKKGEQEDRGLLSLAKLINNAYDPESRANWPEFRTALIAELRSVIGKGDQIHTANIAKMLTGLGLNNRDELIRYVSGYFSNADETYEGIRSALKSGGQEQETQQGGSPSAFYTDPSMATQITYASANGVPIVTLKSTGRYKTKNGSRRHVKYNVFAYDGKGNVWKKVDVKDIPAIHNGMDEGESTSIILSFDNGTNSISIESPNSKSTDRVKLITCDSSHCTISGYPINAELFKDTNTVEEVITRALKATNLGNIPIHTSNAFKSAGKFNVSSILFNNLKFASMVKDKEQPDQYWDNSMEEIGNDLENIVFKYTGSINQGGSEEEARGASADPFANDEIVDEDDDGEEVIMATDETIADDANRKGDEKGRGATSGGAAGADVPGETVDPNEDFAQETGRKVEGAKDRAGEGVRDETISDADEETRAEAKAREEAQALARTKALIETIALAKAGVIPWPYPFPFMHIPVVDGNPQDPDKPPKEDKKTSNKPPHKRPPTEKEGEEGEGEKKDNRRRTPTGHPPDDPDLENEKPGTALGGHTDVHYEPWPSGGKYVQYALDNMMRDFNKGYESLKNIFEDE
jgi:hypothetical protein